MFKNSQPTYFIQIGVIIFESVIVHKYNNLKLYAHYTNHFCEKCFNYIATFAHLIALRSF